MILLMESPVAFRRRDIFTEGEPLRRAGMPRDSRAIANEQGHGSGDAGSEKHGKVPHDVQVSAFVEDVLCLDNQKVADAVDTTARPGIPAGLTTRDDRVVALCRRSGHPLTNHGMNTSG
jgi:hypothetical protein